jgi:integration host factor subunit beta
VAVRGSATPAAPAAPTAPSAQELAQAGTTTKKEIIDRIAADTHQKRAAVKRTVQAFLDTVIEELSAGNRLELRDFGVFEIRERAARTAQNPKTLERVAVPARKTVKFKVGRLMKESVGEQERPEPTKGSKSSRR